MGIQGLLQFSKNASRECHLRELSGTTVAVDAYCWLHKGCFSCAEQLVKGEKTNGYINYCMKLVNLLISNNIKPILVFDGLHLPSKKETEKKRAENRERYKKLGKQYLREGNLKQARDCFTRCVDVTSLMALKVIQACRNLGIDCIVAPYEADAQLGYLNKKGFAQTVITEDSDLILFGCTQIFYKMDITGKGVLLEKSNLHLCSALKPTKYSFPKFRKMCILSGCDYLPSLPGVGLSKACKFFSLTNSDDVSTILKKLPSYLNLPNVVVEQAYINGFIQAENTFLYQLVFDPQERKLVPINPYPDEIDRSSMEYAGPYISDNEAFQIALGNIDVNTLNKIADYNPDDRKTTIKSTSWYQKNNLSIWCKDYVVEASPQKPRVNNLKKPKNKTVTLSANYFKKKSPKKLKSPHKKSIVIDNDSSDVNEKSLQTMYSPTNKRQNTQPNSKTISTSPLTKMKVSNPFKIKQKTPSPKKNVISRFFSTPKSAITEQPSDKQNKESKNQKINEKIVMPISNPDINEISYIEDLEQRKLDEVKEEVLEDKDFCSQKESSLDLLLLPSSNSSIENYEPIPDSQLTVCSIDSMSFTPEFSLLSESNLPAKHNEVQSSPKTSHVTTNVSVKNIKRKPLSLGLSKPAKKKKQDSGMVQLGAKEFLQKFTYKNHK